MNKKIILFLTILLSLPLNSAILIQGDKNAPEGQTFSFTVNKNILSSSGNFYESANEILTVDQQFTLSRLVRGAIAFTPLMPQLVNLNGQPETENPLFGDKIIQLGMLETEDGFVMRDMPVVVSESRPSTVYLFENINQFDNSFIVTPPTGDVHDANGNISPGIVNLTTDITNHVFAAVKPNGGEFGQDNSGIALLIRGFMDVTNKEDESTKKMRIFSELNANNGSIIAPQALRLDPTSNALFINNPLSNIIQNHAIMHWDASLQRLYVGLSVTANSGATDGARSVVAIQFIKDGAIALQTIAPDTAFAPGNTDEIIGVIGAGQQLTVNALSTMYTSTALHYLIVAGDNGNSVTNSVFALPLVNTGDAQGTIAAKNALPENVFRDVNVPRLIGRTISQSATTPDEMTFATDVAAQIGGGPLNTGPIINIIVRNDTVFAFVGENSPGVYSSQAIFDVSGKIIAWTQWQRATGTTDNIFGAALAAFDGTFILASGSDADNVSTIKKTIWSDGSPESLQPLTHILDTVFPTSGVQGLQTFLPNTPGLHNIALLAAGSIGTVVLAQTGLLNSTTNIITPTLGPDFNNMISFDNGTITTDVNAKTVIIAGGALDNIGPITALEIAATATNGWLFVGGSDGLAVLTHPDGTGWDSTTQLSDNLTGLNNGMLFKNIGNYSFVKKLISDNNFLYVIAHDRVDRINLTTSDFGTNTLDITTIAVIGTDGVSLRGGFLDGIFSQACGIIATTDNLLRIGDNKDVRTITDESDAQWQLINIPENAGAPTALYAVTQTNRMQDITKNSGGQFYVLTANVGLNQSRINRFAVQPLGATEPMNSTTIQPFDDLFVKNIPSFLLSFGEFRSNFATDGALYFATRNKNVFIPPIALLTPSIPEPRVGVAGVGDRSSLLNINFEQGTEINYFNRSQASGSWIAAGNFNTQVLE
ncbi:MAG TPA: hypothetical protein VHX42_00630 [Candidatus Babeliales bacterium]|nr:hypothetical protein [Candidatus Babeliales bacterium]